jgi:hypothetical protein
MLKRISLLGQGAWVVPLRTLVVALAFAAMALTGSAGGHWG